MEYSNIFLRERISSGGKILTTKLLEFLVPEAIILGLNASNSEEVIRAVGEKLYNAGYVHDTFIENALEREKNIPTGLPLSGEFNAAIPTTEIAHVVKSVLVGNTCEACCFPLICKSGRKC